MRDKEGRVPQQETVLKENAFKTFNRSVGRSFKACNLVPEQCERQRVGGWVLLLLLVAEQCEGGELVGGFAEELLVGKSELGLNGGDGRVGGGLVVVVGAWGREV